MNGLDKDLPEDTEVKVNATDVGPIVVEIDVTDDELKNDLAVLEPKLANAKQQVLKGYEKTQLEADELQARQKAENEKLEAKILLTRVQKAEEGEREEAALSNVTANATQTEVLTREIVDKLTKINFGHLEGPTIEDDEYDDNYGKENPTVPDENIVAEIVEEATRSDSKNKGKLFGKSLKRIRFENEERAEKAAEDKPAEDKTDEDKKAEVGQKEIVDEKAAVKVLEKAA